MRFLLPAENRSGEAERARIHRMLQMELAMHAAYCNQGGGRNS